MPGNPEVKTISNGVMYTAPDKSAIKAIMSDQQQRNSKTIHYKRSSTASTAADNRTVVPNQLSASNQSTKPTQDTYDSIGNIESQTPGQGHRHPIPSIPPMYRKPYNGISPKLPDRPSSNHRNKPEVPTKHIGKPILPPVKSEKSQAHDHSDSNNSNVENKISNHAENQTSAPKPMPRPNRNRTNKSDQKSDAGNLGDLYDTADAAQVQLKKIPLQPPARPVPRRKPADAKDNNVKQGTENMGYESGDMEIQI